MDIYNEWLVKKKRTGKDTAISFAAVAVGIILCWILIQVIAVFPILSTIVLLVIAGMIWGIYRIITSSNLEYEYIFTNGEMDVDKITNARSRKRVTVVNARKIDILAHKSAPEFKRSLDDDSIKKLYACTSPDSEDLYFLLFRDEDDDDTLKMLLFNPNDKILDGFKKYNPRRVFINE